MDGLREENVELPFIHEIRKRPKIALKESREDRIRRNKNSEEKEDLLLIPSAECLGICVNHGEESELDGDPYEICKEHGDEV